ncbi:Polymerase/histidinol phosphatase-like protein [Zychaea mexicana]|uniref:Polymerase/histidinol phosphatase-like protein n=1 Tax=Zychaea mexicana TaxID=64656 RepID=UPI0022FDD42E|nr:Polymerase/histidinol phosphatase-like protein [Zychaea mexicana]KAI9484535.1 Polymerase/histidinol phosphatase-like protein [Zychaea mexicana]
MQLQQSNSITRLKTPDSTTFLDSVSPDSRSNRATPIPEQPSTRRNRRLDYACCKRYLAGLAIRFGTVIAVIAILLAIGLGLRYTDDMPQAEDFKDLQFSWRVDPRSYLTPFNTSFGQYSVLLDGHSHSTYSDGKMSVRQLLDWHIGMYRHRSIKSDHNTVQGGLAAEQLALQDEYYRDNIVVIPGIEYTCCRIHMNLININESIPVGPPNPSDEELQQVINRVHELGGLVIVNHIPWSNTTEAYYEEARLPNHPSVESLIEWGVDGFEVVHESTFDYATYIAAAQNNLIQMVGTDVHHPSVAANAWLAVQAAEFTKQGVIDAIRARRTSFLMDPAGTRPRDYPGRTAKYDTLLPLSALGTYFSMFYTDYKGMYSFQGTFCHPQRVEIHNSVIGWFNFWFLIFMLVYELVRGAVIFVTHRIKRRGVL